MGIEKPTGPAAGFRTAVFFRSVLVVLVLVVLCAFLSSCQPVEPGPPTMAPCASCSGSGIFGHRSCPSCQGVGYVRVHYRYRVVDPMK